MRTVTVQNLYQLKNENKSYNKILFNTNVFLNYVSIQRYIVYFDKIKMFTKLLVKMKIENMIWAEMKNIWTKKVCKIIITMNLSIYVWKCMTGTRGVVL